MLRKRWNARTIVKKITDEVLRKGWSTTISGKICSNKKYLSQNASLQESQHSIKLVVTTSRNSSRRKNKLGKFYCEKVSRVKACQYNSHYTLTRNHQKVGMEEHGNSRNFHGAMA